MKAFKKCRDTTRTIWPIVDEDDNSVGYLVIAIWPA
jgi:hypothetical protein